MNDNRQNLSLFDQHARRKYLTARERQAVLEAAYREGEPVCGEHPRPGGQKWAFLLTLAYSGCRISEALALTTSAVNVEESVLVFESLKKRQRGHFRAVPVPAALIETLDQERWVSPRLYDGEDKQRLWPVSRTTAWRWVARSMAAAGIEGPQATPKGFRHGFAVQAIASGVPLHMVQKWLGHSNIEMTAIYSQAVGPEERHIAERIWRDEQVGPEPGTPVWPAAWEARSARRCGDAIQRAAARAGYAVAAEALGTAESTIAAWAAGEGMPDMNQACDLAQALGCSVGDLCAAA